MLRQTEISPQMRDKYLDILEQEWNREYSLIKDLLALQQLESGEITYSPQELDLGQTINLVAKSFVDKWQTDREVDLQIEMTQADLKVYTDVESLEHILKELLSNAGKYCDPNTTIKLSVATQTSSSHSLSRSRLPSNGGLTGLRAEPSAQSLAKQDDGALASQMTEPRHDSESFRAVTIGQDEIVISVANVGAGIAPEELPLIFDKFRRGKGVTDRAVPGTGLGLTLVQYFVEHLNGKIDATSEPLDDEATTFLTTFVLRLPQIRPLVS
jgi:signal transduction histidine kinase